MELGGFGAVFELGGVEMEQLKCEICGDTFNSRGFRPFKHCQQCDEELRRQRLGPVQLLERPEVARMIRSIIRREFDPTKG